MKAVRTILMVFILIFVISALYACTGNQTPMAGSTVRFNDLEIGIGKQDSIQLIRVTNQRSKYFSKTVIKVPVTIKNMSSKPQSLIQPYYSFYAPKGDKLQDLSNEYMDYGEANWTGDIEPGKSVDAFFYILFTTPGTYTIALSKAGEDDVKITLDIQQSAAA